MTIVSFGSCLSGVIASLLLGLYAYFFVAVSDRNTYYDLRLLIALFFMSAIRILLPINLPLNYSPRVTKFLPQLFDYLQKESLIPGMMVYQLIFWVCIIVSFVMIFLKYITFRRFTHNIKAVIDYDHDLSCLLHDHPLNKRPGAVSVAYVHTMTSPFVFGALRPTIVLPYDIYSENEIEQILSHELTHINQHDLYLIAAFDWLSAFFWWNPLIWLVRRQVNTAIELSDDVAMEQNMGAHEKLDYAQLLLKTSSLCTNFKSDYALALSTHNDPVLTKRLNRILNTSGNNASRYLFHVCVMLSIVVSSFLITPEPFSLPDDIPENGYDLIEDLNASETNTYILDAGDHYELYINGDFVGNFQTIVEDFKDYPVFTEHPE